MEIAIGQMTSTDQVESNEEQLFDLLEEAKGAYFISFPENSLYLRIAFDGSKFAFDGSEPVFARLSEFAQKNSCLIHLGGIPLRREEKIFNATVFFKPDGTIDMPYDKMHLFDIELEGQTAIRESDYYTHGAQPALYTHQDLKFGLSICYDLRFSELYSEYAKQKANVLLIPAAFLVPTGKAHWQVLLRARAIENQAFVIAAAQAGTHRNENGSQRSSFGHSMIIDPWGRVLAEGGDEIDVIRAEIDLTQVDAVRRQIPMYHHRRLGYK